LDCITLILNLFMYTDCN